MKIGIIREGKYPPDMRVPFSPEQCRTIAERFPGTEIVVQPSAIRCFSDDEYRQCNIPVQEDLSTCDVLMGVKEVPLSALLPDKTYFFFSHTIKKQVYNRTLLQEIIRQNIRLIDYEVLTDKEGSRIIGFGRFAGLVGAYNGLLTMGKRNNWFDLKSAHRCRDLAEMMEIVRELKLPPCRIALTGGGRVAGGVLELLHALSVKQLSPDEFLTVIDTTEAVFTQLNPDDYNRHRRGLSFDLSHFFSHPEEYESNFLRFCQHTDLLIAAAYWDPKAPVLFSSEKMTQNDFRIRVIADITCDIDGSVPSTKRASSIAEPVYDYDPQTGEICPAFSSEKHIQVMAVDNLPCELPRDASLDFGNNLIERVLPHLLGDDPDRIIQRATVTANGTLTDRFAYLTDFLQGK